MTAAQTRCEGLAKFYRIMDCLPRCAFSKFSEYKKDKFPGRGIYFFYEDGENCADGQPRVVRVGTHGTSVKKKSRRHALHERMLSHYGNVKSMSGNHRGSVMRQIIGDAMMNQGPPGLRVKFWGGHKRPEEQPEEDQKKEKSLEIKISKYIRAMSFSVVAVEDGPAPKLADKNMRAYIEENAIALLSNFVRPSGDAPSPKWLGDFCVRTYKSGRINDKVKRSGLWNNKHVDEDCDSTFLPKLEELVKKTISEYPKWWAA